MNADTGEVYRTQDDADMAFLRGERLVEVSNTVADAVEAGKAVLSRHAKTPTYRFIVERRGPNRHTLRAARAQAGRR